MPRRAAPPEPLKLVVFDWDGTLMDSIGTIVECTLAAISDVPEVPAVPPQRIREAIGLGLVQTMERFFPGADPALFDRVADAYRQRWLAEFKGRSSMIAGAREAVERVREAGYFVAVATAKSRAGLERELDQTGLRELVHGSRTVSEAPSKPAPEMLLQLFDEFGVHAREAIMVGDTAWDLEMARNAGSHGVGVLTGGHELHLLEAAGPIACLESVAELPGWLAGEPVRRG